MYLNSDITFWHFLPFFELFWRIQFLRGRGVQVGRSIILGRVILASRNLPDFSRINATVAFELPVI